MKSKNRYEVDSKNRLIIKRGNKKLLARGRFNIDTKNRLSYLLNEPSVWRKLNNLPSKITFEGKWQIDSNHDLVFKLSETKEQFKRNSLNIKTEIVSVDSNVLAVEIKSYNDDGLCNVQILGLTGIWQADEYNRITFCVERKFASDTLVFRGIWQINKNQQIIYAYERIDLKTKTKINKILIFKGFWQIGSNDRLTYILGQGSASCFDFRVQIESNNLYSQKGVIKYRLGVGVKKESSYHEKIVYIFGTWKFSRSLGLVFQVDYGKGQVHSIEFGADLSLSKKDKLSFSLLNNFDEPIGISLTLSRRFLKGNEAEVFLRLEKKLKNLGVEAGLRIPF